MSATFQRMPVATLLVAYVLLLCACGTTRNGEAGPTAGSSDPAGVEGGVLEPIDTGEAGSAVEEPVAGTGAVENLKDKELDYFQGLLDRAARHHVREEYAAALGVIETALSQNPPDPLGPRLMALRVRVKKKLLRRSYLDTFVRFFGDEHTIGDIIEGEIVLMNISEYDLLVPATVKVGVPAARGLNQDESEIGEDAGETESGAVVRSEMTYHEFIPTNTLVTNRKTKNFRIPKDIRLAPGEVHRIPVTINTRDMNPGGTMFRTYTLECVLHSAEIRVGNQLFRGMVPFRPATAGVFPRNAEHLKDAPLKRMKQALQKNSPVHLTLAAAYVDRSNPQELAEVYEFLRTELEREDTLPENADGIMMALVIIADLRETKSKDDWITWLKNREWTRTNR